MTTKIPECVLVLCVCHLENRLGYIYVYLFIDYYVSRPLKNRSSLMNDCCFNSPPHLYLWESSWSSYTLHYFTTVSPTELTLTQAAAICEWDHHWTMSENIFELKERILVIQGPLPLYYNILTFSKTDIVSHKTINF